jgi:hypothetical protein
MGSTSAVASAEGLIACDVHGQGWISPTGAGQFQSDQCKMNIAMPLCL